ncbi:apoptotic chromatin condensation inducer in the nucleus-like [Bradysia coprophila]|uniref:apoptotic chromatin condensation inducer in the nucleus-like n=1 Tax=Bradysia coprophila TaxID=38358 RepID=UPI00187D8B3A|nr:apoptotic chromatin condensation inducer in the nucleus-like [Bradysia coprophila]
MRRKSDRVKTPVAASPAKRSSRRSKRSASDTEEKPQNSDNEQSEQNSGSEQDSDHQPVAKNRRKLSRNTKVTNEEKPVRSRRGRPAKNIETVTEEDEEAETAQQSAVTTEENSIEAEKQKSPSPEPVKVQSPEPVKIQSPEPVRVQSPEPVKLQSPEPVDVKSPEPVKAKTPEPVRVNTPEATTVKSPEPVTMKSPVKVTAKESTPEPVPVAEEVTSSEPAVVEAKANAESVDCLVETDAAKQTEQNNGSSEEAGDKTEESTGEESRTRSKAKEQPTGRRKHRKPSSENVDLQPTEVVKESQRKRRNRFSSPVNEPDNQIQRDEVEETSKVAEDTTDVAPINSKSSEPEVPKDVDKSQDGDGRKSRGEKENKEKRKSDERTVSSEKKQKPIRKRKWLTQKSTEPKPQILAISTDSLKNLISDVKPVPLSDVKLESSPEPEEVEIVPKNDTARSTSSDLRDRSHRNKEHRNESKPDKKHDENASMTSNRKISIVSDDTTTVQRPPSPPKFSSSNILFITNLVRPFTVLQLKGLLARTGKIVDDGFWIDKIKSKCYVKYETEDEAIETRHALHGVRWPASNPKCLNVDFGSEKSMDKAIASTSEQPSKEGVAAAREERVSGGWDRFEVDERKEPAATTRPMREWDVGKKEDLGREREKERERDRGDRNRDRDRQREHPKEAREADRLERRKRSPDITHSVSPARKFHKKENEPPIRLLDDLFRKTKTTPCVYWLPLTSEQIALKEEERRKQQAEQKRRIEQREKERNERNERDRERDRNRGDRDRSDRRRY